MWHVPYACLQATSAPNSYHILQYKYVPVR